ncbi:MAG TPA: tetratricopeptide repeat protein [Candidatus Acidoferrum sp.]|jgi:tetratricopeptide (TPR) repeat protein|nr:tetratricopeptide repeat protein [Candidatus Acidoferrum sp.]
MTRGGQRITAVATGILCAGLLGSPRPLRADASSAIQTAQRQMNSGNYTAAISTLQAAIPGNPSSGELFYWLGRAYYEVRDWDSAIAQGEKSVSLDAKNSLYHDWLGREYGGKADRDRSFSDAKKVKSEFKQAVALDSSNIVARRDLEEYCLDAPWIAGGSKDEALEQVNGIAAVDPVAGHLAKALYAHEGTKNNDDAESELKLVLAAHPKSPDPYFEVADLYRQLNKPADMAAALDEAARVSANDPRLSYYRGVAGVLSNANLPDAERDLKSYLASTPDRSDWPGHAGAREWLGRLYELQGKRADAAEQYREALQLDPKRKEAKSRLEKLEKN